MSLCDPLESYHPGDKLFVDAMSSSEQVWDVPDTESEELEAKGLAAYEDGRIDESQDLFHRAHALKECIRQQKADFNLVSKALNVSKMCERMEMARRPPNVYLAQEWKAIAKHLHQRMQGSLCL